LSRHESAIVEYPANSDRHGAVLRKIDDRRRVLLGPRDEDRAMEVGRRGLWRSRIIHRHGAVLRKIDDRGRGLFWYPDEDRVTKVGRRGLVRRRLWRFRGIVDYWGGVSSQVLWRDHHLYNRQQARLSLNVAVASRGR